MRFVGAATARHETLQHLGTWRNCRATNVPAAHPLIAFERRLVNSRCHLDTGSDADTGDSLSTLRGGASAFLIALCSVSTYCSHWRDRIPRD